MEPKVSAGFGPDVIGFGGMHAEAGVIISGGKGGLGGIGITWRDETVDIGCGHISRYLLRIGRWIWLGEVVILHGDHEYVAQLLGRARQCGEQRAGSASADGHGFAAI